MHHHIIVRIPVRRVGGQVACGKRPGVAKRIGHQRNLGKLHRHRAGAAHALQQRVSGHVFRAGRARFKRGGGIVPLHFHQHGGLDGIQEIQPIGGNQIIVQGRLGHGVIDRHTIAVFGQVGIRVLIQAVVHRGKRGGRLGIKRHGIA